MQMLSRGVAVDETYEYALPDLKPYRAGTGDDYPCARRAAQQVINLPIYPSLSTREVRYVAQCVCRVLQEKAS